MTFPNIFTEEISQQIIDRINSLGSDAQSKWGKMNVAQMMAHCNVTYDMLYTNQYAKPNAFKKFFVKLFAKNAVTGPKPYPKNSRTAPEFLVAAEQDFQREKEKLTSYIRQVVNDGQMAFEGKESMSFGPLSSDQWNNLFYKHLDHHLTQFGV